MTDTLQLKNIAIKCHIGCTKEEQKKVQTIFVDVSFPTDTRIATEQDDINDIVNYSTVAKTIERIVTAKRYHLIETIAECVAAAVLAEFPISSVIIKITKPNPSKKIKIGAAIVEIERFK